MPLVVCQGGLVIVLTRFVAPTSLAFPDKIRLFKSNTTPSESDTAGSYTEADFTGYAGINISDWGSPAFSSGKARVAAGSKVWVNTGVTQSIYGYYVTDGSGNLIFAERDPAAPIVLNNGDSYTVILNFTEDNE